MGNSTFGQAVPYTCRNNAEADGGDVRRPRIEDSELWDSVKDKVPIEDHEEVKGRLIQATYRQVLQRRN